MVQRIMNYKESIHMHTLPIFNGVGDRDTIITVEEQNHNVMTPLENRILGNILRI